MQTAQTPVESLPADRVEVDAKGAAHSFVGPKAVDIFRLISLLSGLRLEMRTDRAMRLSRGVDCRKIARAELGLPKAKYPELIAAIEAKLAEAKATVPVVER